MRPTVGHRQPGNRNEGESDERWPESSVSAHGNLRRGEEQTLCRIRELQRLRKRLMGARGGARAACGAGATCEKSRRCKDKFAPHNAGSAQRGPSIESSRLWLVGI